MITNADFIGELIAEVHEADGLVAAHLADYEELLIHVLMGDLLMLVVNTFSEGRSVVTDRLLAFLDRCLREGDDNVVNAVCVSFVENFGAHSGESDELLSRWPSALRAELGR